MIFSSCYIMVDYDRASMTRMISTSVRIGSLSLVNDDVGEETGTYLVISKADHIEDLESSVDETDEVAKISPRVEIEDHEGNVINKKTETILRVKLRNKINMKRIDRMT